MRPKREKEQDPEGPRSDLWTPGTHRRKESEAQKGKKWFKYVYICIYIYI